MADRDIDGGRGPAEASAATDRSADDQVRRARGQFTCMAATYALGVFNDNFFKQAALVLAVAAGRPQMQGYALVVFTLPFVLFAAPAGWLADRFPKRRVVIGAKWLELAAMLFGAAGICTSHWWLIFAMLGIMGLQATAFSPALNGSIPELYPESYVIRANAVLRVVVTVVILGGIATAGIALDWAGAAVWGIPRGQLIVAVTVVAVALLGLASSAGVPSRPAADPKARFPWHGPVDTVRQLWCIREDPLLMATVFASVFIWFMGSLQILIINPMGLLQFGMSKSATSGLIVCQLAGVAAGGVLSGRIARRDRWIHILWPAGLAFSTLLLAVAAVPWLPEPARLPSLYALIAGVGIAGGVFLIPVESFLQIRPRPERKGTVLAVVNFVTFSGILLSGLSANALNAHLSPTTSFGLLGLFSFVVNAWLHMFFRRHRQEV